MLNRLHIGRGLLLIGVPWLLVLLTSCKDAPVPLKIELNQLLPRLQVVDLQGRHTTLNLASGKLIILNIWATWCAPCRHELPSLQRLADNLDKDRFTVIGLSMDSDTHLVREYLIDKKIRFTNYLDPDLSVTSDQFGVRMYPTTLVISPSGVLLKVIEGWRDWDKPELRAEIQQLAQK